MGAITPAPIGVTNVVECDLITAPANADSNGIDARMIAFYETYGV